MRYPALIDGKDGAYGVVFPDLPGCLAMGYTIDDALLDAEKAIRQWMDAAEERGIPIPDPSLLEDVEVPEGSALTSVLLVRTPRDRPSVRVNLVLDADIADTITSEAKAARYDPKGVCRTSGTPSRASRCLIGLRHHA